jgi:hypothetical protein
MPSATQLLQTSAASIRALFEPAFQQLLGQSSDSEKSELAETGQAMEQALLVIDGSPHTESRNYCHAQSRPRNNTAGLLGSFAKHTGR